MRIASGLIGLEPGVAGSAVRTTLLVVAPALATKSRPDALIAVRNASLRSSSDAPAVRVSVETVVPSISRAKIYPS